MNLPPNLLSAFVTVFVTIGPIETAVVFAALTAGVHRPERKSLAARSVTIAGVVLLLFALGGGAVLSLLRVSMPAPSTRAKHEMRKAPATSRYFRWRFR